jgi:hypothetical protein
MYGVDNLLVPWWHPAGVVACPGRGGVPCGGHWSWVAVEEFRGPGFKVGSVGNWRSVEASPGGCAIRDRVEWDCGRGGGPAEGSGGGGVPPEVGTVITGVVAAASVACESR